MIETIILRFDESIEVLSATRDALAEGLARSARSFWISGAGGSTRTFCETYSAKRRLRRATSFASSWARPPSRSSCEVLEGMS